MQVDQEAANPQTTTEHDPRWARVLARDASADNAFVYGVRTTGVYCRPSSHSRLPRPENVVFFDSPAVAEAAGYRASRRDRPDSSAVSARHAESVAQACRLIGESEEVPNLAEIAAHVGLSRFHFHRVFKALTGLTPKAYAEAHRRQRVHAGLKDGKSVTETLYGAGFNSNGRFYEASDRVLGMRPSDYKAGGANAAIRFAVGECSLGSILVAQSQRGVCAILLGDDPDALVRQLEDRFPRAEMLGGDQDFEGLVARVVGLVETPRLGLDLPLDIRGTAFQERVWRALRDIPVGQTISYAELARRVGAPGSARAVAQACGANVLAVAIPCHRVVRSNGDLSGYRWGVERKRALLERELVEST
jgi:AraC family transcriptional regulator of adaptative response/methylated-DNA-[protein]-cysteine methyltransferase